MSAVGGGSGPTGCCSPFDGAVLTLRQARDTAALFKALADPHRVQIVSLLASGGQPQCVCELTEPLGLGQPTVSHHLKKLTDAGLLVREQRGRWAYYALRHDVAARLAPLVTPGLAGAAEPERPAGGTKP